MQNDLSIELGKLTMTNPFVAASGTYGYGDEWGDLSEPDAFGAIISKGITYKPRKGNPNPRLAETSCGLINSIGLENPGIDAFISEKLPLMKNLKTRVIVNINGETEEEFGVMAGKLAMADGVDAIEVNVSCPNVEGGGMAFGVDQESVGRITKFVRERYDGTLIVKLTPNVTDIRHQAKAALENGADALTVSNTYAAMSIDIEKRASRIGRAYGGYSGPAIKPITLRLVHMVYREFGCEIIASGGIYNLYDCLEYLIAGARALMLGTVNFVDPTRVSSLKNELEKFLNDRKSSLNEIIGSYKE